MKKTALIISSIVIMLGLMATWLVVVYNPLKPFMQEEEAGSFIYTDFGVYVPTGHMYHGIDVSRYQGKINWKQVKEMKVQGIDVDFVFMKATEGTSLVDKRFAYNWKESKKQNLTRGAYHYYLPSASPEQQAKHFIRNVQLEPGDFPPVIDVEDRGKKKLKDFIDDIHQFSQLLEKHYKIKPILYSYDSFYQLHLTQKFPDHILWLARYGAEKPQEQRWHFWQFTDRARVNGIEVLVDMNVFKGDSVQFKRLLLPSPVTSAQ